MQVPLRCRDPGVTHRGLHGGEVDPAGDQLGSVRVAQVVEPQRRQADGIAGSLDAAAERRSVETPAESVGEDVVVRACEVTSLRQAIESTGRLVGHRYLASAAGLRRCDLDITTDRAAHDELAACEVHVAPPQRDQLAAAQAGVGGDADELAVLAVLGVPDRRLRVTDRGRAAIAVQPSYERAGECLDFLG